MRAAVEGSVLILATWGSLKCAESRHGRFRFSPLLEKQPPRPRSNLCYNCKMDYCHGEGIHALKVYLFGALQLQHKSIGSDLMIGRDLELVANEKFPAGDGGHPLLYCVRQWLQEPTVNALQRLACLSNSGWTRMCWWAKHWKPRASVWCIVPSVKLSTVYGHIARRPITLVCNTVWCSSPAKCCPLQTIASVSSKPTPPSRQGYCIKIGQTGSLNCFMDLNLIRQPDNFYNRSVFLEVNM